MCKILNNLLLTASYFLFLLLFSQAAIADVKAARYTPNPTNRFPLKPMTIDDIAVSTVPTTDAITFTPHSRVISSLAVVVVRVVAVVAVGSSTPLLL